jgi:hypothetical protein
VFTFLKDSVPENPIYIASRLSERKFILQKRFAFACYWVNNLSEGAIFSQKCLTWACIWLKLRHKAPSGPQKWGQNGTSNSSPTAC